jgi:hypothetical protein
LGVSDGWNMLMDYADRIDATHVFMLNDDVYSGRNERQINHLLYSHPEISFFNSLQNWCSFILKTESWERIGSFDGVNFPNYFNDNDYCTRMKLLGITRWNTDFLNPDIYRNSMTIAKDPALNNNFSLYQQRYIEKWGGLPNQERFRTPFNQ